jgi:hypothetical protein
MPHRGYLIPQGEALGDGRENGRSERDNMVSLARSALTVHSFPPIRLSTLVFGRFLVRLTLAVVFLSHLQESIWMITLITTLLRPFILSRVGVEFGLVNRFIDHFQAVTTNSCNTIAISTPYSSLEHTV